MSNKNTIGFCTNAMCKCTADIVEIIDENFIVIDYSQLHLIFSVKDQMFNASKLITSISSSEMNTWNRSKSGQLFRKRFPQYFREITTKELKGTDINRLAGTYMDPSMLFVIVSWCNPMLGYFLANGICDECKNDAAGYVYVVQPEEYFDTDIYKIGRTWNPKQRYNNYGKKIRVIREVKVSNMYACESDIISELEEYNLKPLKGKEYYQVEDIDDDLLYHFDENASRYKIKKDQ